MKKVMLTILLLLMVVLSGCAAVQDYLPGCFSSCNDSQEETNDTDVVFENPFEEITDEEVVDEEDDAQDDVEVIDLNEEEVDEEVDKETPTVEVVDEEVAGEEDKQVVLASIDAIEGDLVSLADLIAQDPDGDVIEYTYSSPLSKDGDWQTKDGDEGTYLITVTASDGLLSTSETIKIIVGASNKGPVIDCPTSLAVKEGVAIELPCTIYDKEGDEVSYTVSGFADELNFETSFEDAGVQEIVIKATDGTKETTKTITITISDVNRAPTVLAVKDIVALEGETVTLDIKASDADGDELSITYPLLFDEKGTWKTQKGDAGTYELEAVVEDEDTQVVVPINILIEKLNSAPTLLLETEVLVNEGDLIDLDIDASDVDGEDVQVTISGFMTSETYQTTYDDAGVYEVIVTASDGKKDVSKTVSITIVDVNRPPVFILK